MSSSTCFLCGEAMPSAPHRDGVKDGWVLNCPNCGSFAVTGSVERMLSNPQLTAKQRASLSHAIRKAQRGEDRPQVDSNFVQAMFEDAQLPSARAQIDNLILHLGMTLEEPGAVVQLEPSQMRAVLGCASIPGAAWGLSEAYRLGYVKGIPRDAMNIPFGLVNATLTVEGWELFARLQSSGNASRRVFMAMKFGDRELDSVYTNVFKPAVARAGFELFKLNDEPKAGLIDDRMRLEIRTARILIADLSHGNNGAYWEAGFAEGLGRPVIYTCRKNVFEDFGKRPHFDTNHHHTVVWDPEDLSRAADELTLTIRVTLPGEAKLID